MATTTLPDDAIAAARVTLAELEAEAERVGDVVAAARARLDQLGGPGEDFGNARDPGQERWLQQRSTAKATIAKGTDRLANLTRLEVEQRTIIDQATAARIPEVDDAIAAAKAALAGIPGQLARAEAALTQAEWSVADVEATRVTGGTVPPGEPEASAAAIRAAQSEIETLRAEDRRLQALLVALYDRRERQRVTVADDERAAIVARWEVLADALLKAATRVVTLAGELKVLDDAHRAAGARAGLRPEPVPTTDRLRFSQVELDRLLTRARQQQLSPMVGERLEESGGAPTLPALIPGA